MDFTGNWGPSSLQTPYPLAPPTAHSPLSSLQSFVQHPSHLPTQISAVSSNTTSRECSLKAWLETWKPRLAECEREFYALERQAASLKFLPAHQHQPMLPPTTPKTYAVEGPVCSLPPGQRSLAVPSGCWLPLDSPAPLHANGMDAETAKTSSRQKAFPPIPCTSHSLCLLSFNSITRTNN